MNQWSLSFRSRIDYSAHDEITLEIDLVRGVSPVTIGAKLDTGRKYCVFQPRYAEWLGFDLISGSREKFRTSTGSFLAYGHEITMQIGDLQWTTTVYFAEPEDFPINVVGRIGFLDHLQIGLVDYEQLLYISPYEVP